MIFIIIYDDTSTLHADTSSSHADILSLYGDTLTLYAAGVQFFFYDGQVQDLKSKF